MSTQARKQNYSKFLPTVHTKNGMYTFNPEFIYRSLRKETSISESNAKKITEQVTRFLILIQLELITAPLIREVVNVHLLKMGLEKERLEYTRIGLPFFDLKKIINSKRKTKGIISKIVNWVIWEFYAVKKLLKSK